MFYVLIVNNSQIKEIKYKRFQKKKIMSLNKNEKI